MTRAGYAITIAAACWIGTAVGLTAGIAGGVVVTLLTLVTGAAVTEYLELHRKGTQ